MQTAEEILKEKAYLRGDTFELVVNYQDALNIIQKLQNTSHQLLLDEVNRLNGIIQELEKPKEYKVKPGSIPPTQRRG